MNIDMFYCKFCQKAILPIIKTALIRGYQRGRNNEDNGNERLD